jgi:hypothetical protein
MKSTLLAALGKVKMDCMNGKVEQAYKAAAALKLNPQSANAP